MNSQPLKGIFFWTIVLSAVSIIAVDFLFHAGIFKSVYEQPRPPILNNQEAFSRIPFGYLSFVILDIFLIWLMNKLEIQTLKEGYTFGLMYGSIISLGFLMGLYSIIDIDIEFLSIWFIGQVTESGVAGGVIGSINSGTPLKRVQINVLILVIACLIVGILLQNI